MNKSMFRALMVSALGIGGGQFVVLLTMPLLSRIYGPEDFGVYSGVVALGGVLASVSSLRLDASIPSASADDVGPLYWLALFCPFVICPIAIGIVALIGGCFAVNYGSLSAVIGWPSLIVAISQGMVCVVIGYCTRAGWFGRASLVRVVQPIVFSAVALTSVLPLEGSLIVGWTLAMAVGVYCCRRVVLRVDVALIWGVVRRQRQYLIVSAPMTLVDALAVSLPVLFMISCYGSDSTGAYAQVQRLVGAPVIMIGMVVSQVFYKYAGDRQRNGLNVNRLLWRVVGVMSAVGVMAMILLAFFGDIILLLLLGPGWRVETTFILLAYIPVAVRVIVSSVSTVFMLYNRLKLLALWQAGYFLVTAATIWMGKAFMTFDEYLLVYAAVEAVMYATYLIMANSVTVPRNPSVGSVCVE